MRTVKLVKSDSINTIKTNLEAAVEADRLLAQAARTGAETAQGLSEAARDKSQQWAENPEDTEVEAGKYSALHWAAKAEANATTIIESADMIIRHEAEIASLENTLNSANINQETTATASGVDTIALPKTAANTGMQVRMFGQSAQNLVVNGDFRNGTTGWSTNATISASNNVVTFSFVNAGGGAAMMVTVNSTVLNNKYYSRADYFIPNENTVASIILGNRNQADYLLNQSKGVWLNYSAVKSITSVGEVFIISNGDVSSAANSFLLRNILCINLTATFGAGNEPTKEQCDILFANYFEGTDNVLGTGRVRSIGNNSIPTPYIRGFQVSNTDGTFVAGATFSRSNYFRVQQSTAYTLSSDTNTGTDHRIAFYDVNKVFISGVAQTLNTAITVTSPATAYYAIVSSLTNKVDAFRLTRGTSSFETYRESSLYLTTPALRSNGLIKDEIRKGTNGYELVKRVGVGTLTEKITNAADREFSSDTGFWTLNPTYCEITGGNLTLTNTANGVGLIKTGFLTIGKRYKVTLTDVVVTEGYISFGGSLPEAHIIYINTAIIEITSIASLTTFFLIGYDNLTCSIGGISIKEVTEAEAIADASTFTELGNNVHYTLATPVITPIPHAGLLNSNANGTAYFEPIIADAGVYSDSLAIQLTDYPINAFESIRKYSGGTYTELDTATAVIASGGLSFTHPDLVSGDLVMFTYAYANESIGRSMTLTHYDSRFVEADTANGKVYRIVPVVTNGVVSWTTVEV